MPAILAVSRTDNFSSIVREDRLCLLILPRESGAFLKFVREGSSSRRMSRGNCGSGYAGTSEPSSTMSASSPAEGVVAMVVLALQAVGSVETEDSEEPEE
ncbi:unnamed protein product [Closterium sp. NIES-64]|nr:unnamed protein product [Closterium sp. NIES-64]